MDNIFMDALHKPITNSLRDMRKKYYMNSKAMYRHVEENGETPLFYHDYTITGSGKEGFVLTDKALHYTSPKLGSGSISYADIKTIERRQKGLTEVLCINDTIYLPINGTMLGGEDLRNGLVNVFIPTMLRYYAQPST